MPRTPSVDHIHVEYRRTFDHALDKAYGWLTDYDEADPQRAGGIIQERTAIEERADDLIVFDGHIKTMGRDAHGHAEVELDPPDHWTAYLHDEKGRLGDIYDYRLEPKGEDRCELVVDYAFAAPKLKHKLQLMVGKPLIRRKLDDMWDGFEEAMDRELGQQPPTPAQ